ncbi:MAG: ImmA/IrrE family metallo-endopeptidase [Dehalococcoidales bacterium]|nr:ImmA/IrrE family metallo-endopeptidase [Dehalococcoidales bacterium]
MVSDLSLTDFCRLAFNASNRRFAADPVQLGKLFRQYAGIERTPSLKRTVELVRSLGIVIEEVDCLSTHGANMLDKDRVWHLIYAAKDQPATQKFTIFHELFEILQKSFAELAPSYHSPQEIETNQSAKRSAERSADRFAGAVLLSSQLFVKHLIATGCDLVKLAEGLELSHQCLLVAMEQHLAKLPFVGALYEYQPRDGIRSRQKAYDYLATLVVKTGVPWPIPEICRWQTEPVLNERPQGGSLICAALQGGYPIFYQSEGNENSAAILVRPLFSGARRPSRLVFLVLPGAKSDRFFPQADLIQAITVNENSVCPSAYKCRNSLNCRWKR